MVDFGESDKMLKICGKVNESNTYNVFSGNVSFFVNKRTSSNKTFSEVFYILANEGKYKLKS